MSDILFTQAHWPVSGIVSACLSSFHSCTSEKRYPDPLQRINHVSCAGNVDPDLLCHWLTVTTFAVLRHQHPVLIAPLTSLSLAQFFSPAEPIKRAFVRLVFYDETICLCFFLASLMHRPAVPKATGSTRKLQQLLWMREVQRGCLFSAIVFAKTWTEGHKMLPHCNGI